MTSTELSELNALQEVARCNRKLVDADELVEHLHRLGVQVASSTVKRWGREQRIPVVRVTRRTIRYDLARSLAALGIAEGI